LEFGKDKVEGGLGTGFRAFVRELISPSVDQSWRDINGLGGTYAISVKPTMERTIAKKKFHDSDRK
jgi:hypothetical protein